MLNFVVSLASETISEDMKTAYMFPGQGAQFTGMGKDLYDSSPKAAELFGEADEILGFRLSDIMFNGTAEDLRRTEVTQPAVFVHSVVSALCREEFRPDMVAGHSLGELSALTAAGVLSFEDGLRLVGVRARAMQKACEETPSTMAAVLGLADDVVERICAEVSAEGDSVVPANYNCPGQIAISGGVDAVSRASGLLVEAGAKRVVPLAVGGAFHSVYMESARREFAEAVAKTAFNSPACPVYQNVDALPHVSPEEIRGNVLLQLTSPVRWTQEVRRMLADGAEQFVECGPGEVLTGLVKRIRRSL